MANYTAEYKVKLLNYTTLGYKKLLMLIHLCKLWAVDRSKASQNRPIANRLSHRNWDETWAWGCSLTSKYKCTRCETVICSPGHLSHIWHRERYHKWLWKREFEACRGRMRSRHSLSEALYLKRRVTFNMNDFQSNRSKWLLCFGEWPVTRLWARHTQAENGEDGFETNI